jgi:hypothetical protein
LLTLINPKGLLVVSFIVPAQTFIDLTLYLQFVGQFTAVVIPRAAPGCCSAHASSAAAMRLTAHTINRTASVVICGFAVAILTRLADSLIHTSVMP